MNPEDDEEVVRLARDRLGVDGREITDKEIASAIEGTSLEGRISLEIAWKRLLGSVKSAFRIGVK